MISKALMCHLRDNWCLQFGYCNPHNHICIKQLEAMTPICLTCKRLTKLNKEEEINEKKTYYWMSGLLWLCILVNLTYVGIARDWRSIVNIMVGLFCFGVWYFLYYRRREAWRK